ncbi:tbc and lysm domain containing protein [Dermatophagoides farinae]|uniref:Oxidation resistance protein 1 n=1 Tax=Dermatophagoides farinae TaxID=6954 RepID=A0A9D4SCQ6_DERFA|nr:tbc and lysm domain containing protein [Dermatophagoides farinae]
MSNDNKQCDSVISTTTTTTTTNNNNKQSSSTSSTTTAKTNQQNECIETIIEENSSNNSQQQNKQKMPLSRSLTQPQGTIEYVVAANDTITSVAARFQTTPSELARINRRSGHFIFPGQVLYVPKSNHVSSLSADIVTDGSSLLVRQSSEIGVPPNTPNDPKSQSPSRQQLSNKTALSDNQQHQHSIASALPGHAERCTLSSSSSSQQNDNTGSTDCVFTGDNNESNKPNNSSIIIHYPLMHTSSEPVVITGNQSTNQPVFGVSQQLESMLLSSKSQQQPTATATIDPADRECLERFLKINVRYITDGQGVVGGVLLVTPNALMFDSNVSDPLVVEHGSEVYNVTVPIELVLKTALYSDIAHMRVKHAPEAVPSVPKPSVYYASDEDNSGIVEENLKNVYAKNAKTGFDTIGKVSEEKSDSEQQQQQSKDEEEFKDAVEHLQKSNGEIVDNDPDRQPQQPPSTCSSVDANEQSAKQSSLSTDVQIGDEDVSSMNRVSIEIENSVDFHDDDQQSTETTTNLNTSIDVNSSLDLMMTSMDDADLVVGVGSGSQSSSGTENQSKLARKPLATQMAKMTLAERHSAPLQPSNNNHQNSVDTIEHKALQTAISAEETCSDPVVLRHPNRLSAAGENRRGQMLKRLSNPVDAIGNFTKSGISSGINATKSGFNATKTGISKGINATQSGISTGLNATKSGLTTTMNVTKTGFNKVLSTPKNLMDFSSGLVRDAKGALATTGSKSDINLHEHLMETNASDQPSDTSIKPVGYCNMVTTKIDAFENFDKLIPRPARVNKDAPLYLCIRMGKYKKNNAKRSMQRFSPTSSFGKNRYEREYWFSVPKDKASNLYHFFKKWAPEIYGDVDDISGCEHRGLEPINTDDEYDIDDDDDGQQMPDTASALSNSRRRSYQRISSNSTELIGDSKSSLDDPTKSLDMASTNRQRFWRRSPLHFLKLVEDHFSTEWNVSNSSEEHSFAERYHLELSNEPILPELIGTTEMLDVDIIQNLMKHLPARAEGYAWTLIYSTSQHGFSLNTLYRDMKHFDSPVLLIIEDTNGAKFGALLSHSLKISDHFYGTGETFLFTFYPTFECFPWTGENIFFIKGNIDSISIGAGEGNFGLWLDGDLYHGSSHPCKTFGNRTLSSEEDFVVKSIECWGFV